MNEDWKPFWFKMQPAQFLADRDIDCMTPSELGAFFRLVCRQFIDGHLPDDRKLLARLSRLSESELDNCWDMIERMFPIIEEGKRANRYNKQLRDEAISDHNIRSSFATKAVNKRWDKKIKEDITDNKVTIASVIKEQDKMSSIITEWITDETDRDVFNIIWDTWSHRKDGRYAKGDRIKAEKNFSIILSNGICSYQLLCTAQLYKQHPNVVEGFVRQIATFFEPHEGIYLELLKCVVRLPESEESNYIKQAKESVAIRNRFQAHQSVNSPN